jgi:hypothetical protein
VGTSMSASGQFFMSADRLVPNLIDNAVVNLRGCARGCPGQDLPQSDSPIVWDIGVCHDW